MVLPLAMIIGYFYMGEDYIRVRVLHLIDANRFFLRVFDGTRLLHVC